MDFHRIDSLEDIDDFYHNIKKSLILRERCIIVGECAEKRFLHFNQEEIRYFFKKHHQYSELNCVFNVLGLIESRFKIDFEKRISARQDNLYKSLSNQFKLLKAKNNDSFIPIRKILDVWEEETPHFTLIKSYND